MTSQLDLDDYLHQQAERWAEWKTAAGWRGPYLSGADHREFDLWLSAGAQERGRLAESISGIFPKSPSF